MWVFVLIVTLGIRESRLNAIRIDRRLDSQVLDLPELAPLVGKRVQIIVLEEPAVESSQVTAARPQAEPVALPTRSAFGCGKGEVLYMAPDFDATPGEFAEYM